MRRVRPRQRAKLVRLCGEARRREELERIRIVFFIVIFLLFFVVRETPSLYITKKKIKYFTIITISWRIWENSLNWNSNWKSSFADLFIWRRGK